MKVLCDVHVALKVVRFFQGREVEAMHVNDLPDSFYSSDTDICKFADQNDYVVVTKDSDFLDSYLVQQTPLKLIKVNLGNIATPELIVIFEQHLDFSKNIPKKVVDVSRWIKAVFLFIVPCAHKSVLLRT